MTASKHRDRPLGDQFLLEWWFVAWALGGGAIALLSGSVGFLMGWLLGGVLFPPIRRLRSVENGSEAPR